MAGGEKRREISSQAFGHSWCRAALSLLKLHAYLKLIKHIPYLLSRAFLMQSIKWESSVCVFVYVCGCACPADDLLYSISQLAVKDKWNLWRAASKNDEPIPSVVPGTRSQSLAADVVGEAACVCVCVCAGETTATSGSCQIQDEASWGSRSTWWCYN